MGAPVTVSLVLRETTLELSHADIKALPTTGIQIVASPHGGRFLLPFIATWHMKWVADYTNIDADCQLLVKQFNSTLLTPIREDTLAGVTALLAGGGPDGTHAVMHGLIVENALGGVYAAMGNLYDSDLVGFPLMIVADNAGSGNFTGGDPGNKLTVSVGYFERSL